MRLLPRRFVARVDRWARLVVDESAQKAGAQVTVGVEQTVRDEMRELARMLRQQGDAADELAETFGRTLLRLSEAVEDLQARLDRLEAGEERRAGSV
jgi:hypothetical protein